MLIWPDGKTRGSLGAQELNAEVVTWACQQMQAQESNWRRFANADVFVDVLPPPARLIIVGAVHIAIPLVTMAKTLGFYTVVIDPRRAFATPERFAHADQLIIDWPALAIQKLQPDENTFVAVLSHDEKLDNPALQVALSTPARYVGVLGSRKNLSKRFAALRQLGVSEEQLSRLHAPIGVPLGAVTPEEIALSILTAVVAARHGVLERYLPSQTGVFSRPSSGTKTMPMNSAQNRPDTPSGTTAWCCKVAKWTFPTWKP
ncbi:MAG: XdhC family protein [Anaerolineae bacterium]